MRNLRVLVVDDSARNRRTISDMLSAIAGVTVVAHASDGDEALRMAVSQKPDLITLDLEMPRMDGFSFLRLLMATRPTPVIIVSSHSAKDNVFRALELGALDFISKPGDWPTDSSNSVADQLLRMVKMVRQLSPFGLEPEKRRLLRAQVAAVNGRAARMKSGTAAVLDKALEKLVVIASSTGGPAALIEVFARLPDEALAAIIVAQHMPERFTKTFAERLDRISGFNVAEATDIQPLVGSQALVCPGGRSIEVCKDGNRWLAKVVMPDSSDRYAPSADRLFSSAARIAGEKVIAIVLTGMGDDGADGVAAVKKAGGLVLAEAEETAVIYGMPRAAQRTGQVDRVLPLRDLAEELVKLIS
jgi:two-component system, chemotaxis family, protein-glutamate methylesterase/glutaminase